MPAIGDVGGDGAFGMDGSCGCTYKKTELVSNPADETGAEMRFTAVSPLTLPSAPPSERRLRSPAARFCCSSGNADAEVGCWMGTVGTEGSDGATLPRSVGHVPIVALRWWAGGISGSASSEMKCDKIKSFENDTFN